MSRRRTTDDETRREKRRLRTEIARSRRRLVADAASMQREGRRLVSWRTYAARFPVAALGIAFVGGLAVSTGLMRHATPRRWVARLMRPTFAIVGRGLWRELHAVWRDASPAGGRTSS